MSDTLVIETLPVQAPILSTPNPADIVIPQPEAKHISDLVKTTFFLRMRYGSIGNTRKVPGAQVLTTDADVSFLRVSKTLLESTELEAIRKHDSMLRKWMGNMCLPLIDWPGVVVLPKAMLKTAQAKLTEHAQERAALVELFITAYPQRVEESKKSLGTLHNPLEYPSVEEVKKSFVFDWQLLSFDTPESLKEIDPDLYVQQQEKVQQQLTTAADEIAAVMREGLFQMVTHLKERLTPGPDGKAKIFKESAVNNLKGFLDTFDIRNVTNDKELALEVAKARALLNGTTATTLRSSDDFRTKVLAGLENITGNLGKMVEEKPGRKFRDE